MAYELYIYPPEGAFQAPSPQAVVSAFAAAGLPVSEDPDEFGHWLVMENMESALDLTLQEQAVTGANFRYCTTDDESVIQRVADVFKSVGFLVSDDEGEL